MFRVLTHIKPLVSSCFYLFQRCLLRWTKPSHTPLVLGTVMDVAREKSELIAENAFLRQQLVILRRQINRPRYTKTDRLLLVLLARAVRPWRQALLIVQPETLLKWHRQGFRLFWKQKSKAKSAQAKVEAQTIALIKEMASNNRLWGAERIRGELLKLGIRVCKRTIQKYMRVVRTPRPKGQKWATFLRNHAGEIWACDFLQVTDLLFRSFFAFFIIELKSRKVIHVGVTRAPTDAWTAQQLREATPYGHMPKYLIRDHDSKFGPCFARVAVTSGIKVLKTPYHAPRVPKSGLNASRGKPYYLKRLSCAYFRVFELSGRNFHPLVSTEGEDELPILLHTWREKHEILVYPIHRCMLELRAHAEMKSNITHFENGCAK